MYLVIVSHDKRKGLIVDLKWFIPGLLTTDDVDFINEYVIELSDLVEEDSWDFDDEMIQNLKFANIAALIRVKDLIDKIRLGASTSIGTNIAPMLAMWGVWSVFGGDIFIIDSDSLDELIEDFEKRGIKVIRW